MKDDIDKKYLVQENKKLNQQVKQMKQLIQLHKQAIYRLSQPQTTINDIISVLLQLIFNNRQIRKVIKDNTLSQIDNLNKKISDLESYQMVLEKIVQQTTYDEKLNYSLLAKSYKKDKQNNEILQNSLHKFEEKIGQVDYLSGLVTKYKQIISPTEQTLSFKKQQNQLLDFLAIQKQSIRKLTEQKNKLLKINIHMKQSLEKHKEQLRNMTLLMNQSQILTSHSAHSIPTCQNTTNILEELNEEDLSHGDLKDSNSTSHNLLNNVSLSNINTSTANTTTLTKPPNPTINFIKMQRKIIKQNQQQVINSSSSSNQQQCDCPQINILFPEKVQTIKKNKQLAKVPYLNMVKIREIMAKRENIMRKEVQAENRHVNPTDKIIQLETELEITRKQLTNITLKFRNMSQQLKTTLKLNQQLLQRNQLLISSNLRLKTNYTNIFKDYQQTKIIALRVQRAMTNQFANCQIKIDQINSTFDLEDQKIENVELALRKIFGNKILPTRSQSL